jgi:hypothetical protein
MGGKGTGVVDVNPFGGLAFDEFAVDDVFDGGDSGEEARELSAGRTDGSCKHETETKR